MSSSSCFLTTDLDVLTLEQQQQQQQQVIHQINPADVMLGRGKRALFWDGNVVFRKLCEAAAPSYQNASSGGGIGKSGEGCRAKEAIVTNVIAQIHRAGGRFVREQDFVCTTDGMWRTVWLTVPTNVVRTKVKQACRDTVRNRHGRGGCCAGRINDDDDTNNMVSMTLSGTEPRLHHGPRTTVPDQTLDRDQTSLQAPGGERPMAPPPDVEVRPEESAPTVAAPAAAATPNEPSDAELMAALLSMYEVFSSSSSSSSRRKSHRRQCNMTEPMTTARRQQQLPHDHMVHHHLPRSVSDDGLYDMPPPPPLLPPPSIDTAATALASTVPGEIQAYRCYDHPSLGPHTGFNASHNPSSFFQCGNGDASCSVARHGGARDAAAAAVVQGGCVSTAHHDDHDNTLYSLLTLTPVERRLLAAEDPLVGFFCFPQEPPPMQDDQLHEAASRMCFDS